MSPRTIANRAEVYAMQLRRLAADVAAGDAARAYHIPDVCRVVTPTPCPRCHGRGYFTEDPLPDCPGVDYEEHECRKCEGSGEAAP